MTVTTELTPDVCENVDITTLTSSSDGLPNPVSTLPRSEVASKSPTTIPTKPTESYDAEVESLQSTVIDKPFENTLKSAADTITSRLNDGLSGSLESDIERWCDLHGLSDVQSVETREFIARQVIINFFVKITLHECYYQRGDVPALRADPFETLQQINEQIELPTVSEYILDELLQFANKEALNNILSERHRLLESAQPEEDIGQLYETLTTNPDRRTIGFFRTPPEVGEFMRRWAVSDGDIALDPGIGAGVLSSSYHPRWDIGLEETRILGVDRSQLALLMGTTALTLYRRPHDALNTDFLNLEPTDLPENVDSIVCNPPYTSNEDLSSDYRDELKDQLQQETRGEVPGKLPLLGYFICHARRFLSPGGRAAFIIPRHVLGTRYGEWLKQFLLDEFAIEAFVRFNQDGLIFDQAQSTGLVVLLEAKGEEEQSGYTQFIRVDEDPERFAIRKAIRNDQQGETDWGIINRVKQSTLNPEQKWRSLFSPSEIDTSGLIPFSEIADISRGISTGECSFFCLTQREVDKWNLNETHLSPLTRQPELVQGYSFDQQCWNRQRNQENDVWLLYIRNEVDGIPKTIAKAETVEAGWSDTKEFREPIAAYLREGLCNCQDLYERSKLREGELWYRVETREPAPVLIPNSIRSGFWAMLNKTNARHLNNFNGVYPDSNITDQQLKALLAYLNSPTVEKIIQQHKRTDNNGWHKVGPGDLEDLQVIDLHRVSDDVINTLAELFDRLQNELRCDEASTQLLEQIDTILQMELSVTNNRNN